MFGAVERERASGPGTQQRSSCRGSPRSAPLLSSSPLERNGRAATVTNATTGLPVSSPSLSPQPLLCTQPTTAISHGTTTLPPPPLNKPHTHSPTFYHSHPRSTRLHTVQEEAGNPLPHTTADDTHAKPQQSVLLLLGDSHPSNLRICPVSPYIASIQTIPICRSKSLRQLY